MILKASSLETAPARTSTQARLALDHAEGPPVQLFGVGDLLKVRGEASSPSVQEELVLLAPLRIPEGLVGDVEPAPELAQSGPARVELSEGFGPPPDRPLDVAEVEGLGRRLRRGA